MRQFQAERGHVQLWGELEKNREQGLEKVTFGDLDMASTRTHTLWAERTTQRRQGGARKRGQLGLSTGPHPGLSHSLGGRSPVTPCGSTAVAALPDPVVGCSVARASLCYLVALCLWSPRALCLLSHLQAFGRAAPSACNVLPGSCTWREQHILGDSPALGRICWLGQS